MAGNIQQYNSPIDKLEPSDRGIDALAREGREIGTPYREMGEQVGKASSQLGAFITQHETMSEISQGSAALAVMHNNLTTQWNQIAATADPNDHTIQEKFLNDTAEPQLAAFSGGFDTERGQEWALSQADSLRTHLWDKTSADMSARAGNAIVLNLKTTLSNLSDAARKDPSSISQSLGQVDAVVAASKANSAGVLNQEQLDKLDDMSHDMKNEIVKSGVMGMADVNPMAAVKTIDSGGLKDYLSGPEAEELKKYAEGVTRMKLEDESRAYENKQRAQTETDEAATTKVINSLYNQDTGRLTIPDNINQQIWSMPGVSGKAKLGMLGAVKNISKETVDDDPKMIEDFASRLKSNSDSPLTQDDLLTAMATGHMTPSTFNFFNEHLKNTPDTHAENEMVAQTMDQWKNNILKPQFGQPNTPGAEDAYTRWQTWFLPAYALAKKDPSLAGMSEAQKAQTLLSPDSPKYMLTPELMKKFMAAGDDLIPGMVSPGQPLPSGNDRKPLDQIFGPKQ